MSKIISFILFALLVVSVAHAKEETTKNHTSTRLESWDLKMMNSEIDLKYNTGSFRMGDNFGGTSSSFLADFMFGLKISPWTYGLFLGLGTEKIGVDKKNYNYFEDAQATKERAGLYTKYEMTPSFYLLGKVTVYQELNLKSFNFEEYFYDLSDTYEHTETLNKNVKLRGREVELGAGYRFSRLFSFLISYHSTTYVTKSAIKKVGHTADYMTYYRIENNVPARLSVSGVGLSFLIDLY